MDECNDFEVLIDRVGAGEATADEASRLSAHVESCPACGELYDLLVRLVRESAPPEIGAAELAALRARVLAEGRREPIERRAPRLLNWTGTTRRFVAQLAAATLVLLLGVALGWRGERGRERALGGGAELEGQIRRAAFDHQRLEEVEDSPYSFGDVRVGPAAGGRYRLEFTVSRHLDLELAAGDPLLGDVLAQAIVGGASVGGRIEAIGVADAAIEPSLRRALLVALRFDSNLGVRLGALARLGARAGEPDVQAALLDVLAHDEAVPMRLAAIDALTASRVPRHRIESALTAGGDAADATGAAVRASALRYLDDPRPAVLKGAVR